MESQHKILVLDDDADWLALSREMFAQLPSQPEIHGMYLRRQLRTNPRRPVVVDPAGASSEREKVATRLDEIVRRRRVLARIVREPHDSFVFPHRSILEYLASCELSESACPALSETRY